MWYEKASLRNVSFCLNKAVLKLFLFYHAWVHSIYCLNLHNWSLLQLRDPHSAHTGQYVSSNPSWPVQSGSHQNNTFALVLLPNTSRYERFHHKLSVICVYAGFPCAGCFLICFSSSAISESVFWRKAARDPRHCLFAFYLKLLPLQKCNKFPCKDVHVSVQAGRLIFSSLLLLLCHLKKTENYMTERVFLSGHLYRNDIRCTQTPWCLLCGYGQDILPMILPMMLQIGSFHSGALPGKLHCSRLLFVSFMS